MIRKKAGFFPVLLGGIMVLFIAILITVYLIARQANPIFLDEKGNPVQSQSDTYHH